MAKLVVITISEGSLFKGFLVTLILESSENHILAEVSGKLPPYPQLDELFKEWQLAYSNLRFSWRSLRKKTQLSNSIVGKEQFQKISHNLEETLNNWLDYPDFRNIKEEFLSQLNRSEEIRVLIRTDDIQVQRLPWHLWDVFKYYPKAEVAFGSPTYTRIHDVSSRQLKSKARILAILGNNQGINTQQDRELLENLSDTEIIFLVEPSRRELDRALWDEDGWDILFFAGHSYSEIDEKAGYLYINQQQSLEIKDLKNALKVSIKRGLQIAIFNSCDGLGLAHNLAELNIPQVICMRETVPDIVAHEFLLNFLHSFSKGKSLYISVREAREKLQGLESDFPCASWLPVIFQNLGESPPTWHELCPMSLLTQQQTYNENAMVLTKRIEAWNQWRENNFELIPDLKGIDLSGANLRGANLSRVNLSGVNLMGGNLNNANLKEANLTGANLTAVQALNANFEKALLTGACIQNCNINDQTKIDGIICSYIYMQDSQQERCPSSGNFAPGEFTMLVQKVIKTSEHILREGLGPKSFAQSSQKIQVKNEDEELEIQSIEKNGDNIVVRVRISPDADKAKIHSEFIRGYELAKETIEAQYQAKQEDQDKQIERLLLVSREHQERLLELSKVKTETITNISHATISGFVSSSGQGVQIGNNYYNSASEEKQTLAEAAAEIQQLLEQLDLSYPTNTTADKMILASKAIQQIESNPILKARLLNALKIAGVSAFEQLLNHPLASVVTSFVIGELEDS